MVILFAADDYLRKGEVYYGGFLAYLHRVTIALVELGHMPIVVACGKNRKHYMQDGVEIYTVRCTPREIPVKNVRIGYEMYYRSRIINKKIKEIAQERAIDIIQFTSLQGLAVCYHGDIPAVLRLSEYAKTYYMRWSRSRAEANVMSFIERRAAAHCNAIFSPGKMVADVFSQDIGRPVSIIESPFVNDVTDYDESIYRKYLENKKYVLFFGAFTSANGIFVIADIIYRFLQMHKQYYFVCIGQDMVMEGKSMANILRNNAGEFKERFVYIPPLSHERLYPVIQRADFVILPSLTDNFSNACIEAMYFERVVIGTEGASFEQLINDGKSGLLCKLNDRDSLLQKMDEAVMLDEIKKKEMGQMARKRIDRLTPERVGRKLIRYYQYVIDSVSK